MTDKKFTDEEIIKVLENYIKENEFEYFHSDMMGEYPLIRKSLDLINRQKSEIERLQKEVNIVSIQFQDLQERTNEVKAEAYKEFAEKLKEKIGDCHIVSDGEYCGFDCGDIHRCIDNLLKEMVGEEE